MTNRWFCLLVLVVLASGCGIRFRPAFPMRARSGDVELDLQSVRVGIAPQLVFESRSSAPHVIRRGWLTTATRSPCSGGADINRFTVDDVGGPEGFLPPGSHTVSLDFTDNLGGYSLDAVADLEMADGICVRAPALSQAVPMDAAPRFLIVAGGSIMGNPALAGVETMADFHAGLGRTLGSVLASAEVGAGVTQCSAAVCGKRDDGKVPTASAFSVSLAARRAWEIPGGLARGTFASLGARYGFVTTRPPALDVDRRLALHTVQGMLGWGMGVGFAGPFRHRERTLAMELTIPLGVMIEQSAPRQVVFIGGFEFRFLYDV